MPDGDRFRANRDGGRVFGEIIGQHGELSGS